MLVFSVTQYKIDQIKTSKPFNRLSSESGKLKEVNIQRPSPRFGSEEYFVYEISEEMFYPSL